jgi:hypothetical protein
MRYPDDPIIALRLACLVDSSGSSVLVFALIKFVLSPLFLGAVLGVSVAIGVARFLKCPLRLFVLAHLIHFCPKRSPFAPNYIDFHLQCVLRCLALIGLLCISPP